MQVITQDLFLKQEAYNASEIEHLYPFMKSSDEIDGYRCSFGNMCSGYPFNLLGTNISFYNSEAAYIAGLFSNDTDEHRNIQQQLIVCQNGYEAKRDIRIPMTHLQRSDIYDFNITWMFYVVWSKCKTNSDFANLLLSLPDDAVIIENSYHQTSPSATIWGTRNELLKTSLKEKQNQLLLSNQYKKEQIYHIISKLRCTDYLHCGVFTGCNVMGKILMICKRCLKYNIEAPIDYNLLNLKKIHINGQILTF